MNATNPNRPRVLVVAALAILSIYAAMSVLSERSSLAELTQARADLAEVTGKLAEIERLQQAPKVAAMQLESPAEITNRVAAARRAAGLPQASLLKEEPLDPQRIQRSDFQQRSTLIQLAPATLPEVMRFCDAIRDAETGTVVRDITLSEPPNGASGGPEEKWEVGLTLTQIIFSPTSR